MLNYTHSILRDAPLREPRNFKILNNFLPGKSDWSVENYVRRSDFNIVDVLDFLAPEQKSGQYFIFQNGKLISKS
jgi:hypothetical protein